MTLYGWLALAALVWASVVVPLGIIVGKAAALKGVKR